MASNIHAASEEGLPDEEQYSVYLRISIVSGIASSLPSDHLDMRGSSFLRIREKFGAVKSQAGGGVP